MDRLSIKAKLTLTFILIIISILIPITIINVTLQQKQILNMAGIQLLDAARSDVDKITQLQATVDSRKFDSKLQYIMANQQSDYLSRGYHLQQLLISHNDDVKAFASERPALPPASQIKNMWGRQNGVIRFTANQKRSVAAYAFSTDIMSMMVLVVPEPDYLHPVLQTRNLILAVGFLLLLIGSVITFLIASRMSRPMARLASAAKELEQGIFDIEIEEETNGPEYRLLSSSLKKMVETLRAYVVRVKGTVEELRGASTHLFQQVADIEAAAMAIEDNQNQIHKRVGHQLVSVEDIRAIIQQLGGNAAEIAASNQASIAVSSNILQQAGQGLEVLREVHRQMQKVLDTTLRNSQTFEALSNQFKLLMEVSASINGIANTTKLLALNANIEAARAGKYGASFMVVANQITELAQRTQAFLQQSTNIIFTSDQEYKLLKTEQNSLCQEVQNCAQAVEMSGSVFSLIHQQAIENSQSIETVENSIHSMLSLLEHLKIKAEAIYNECQQIASSTPAMLELTSQQVRRSEECGVNSEELRSLATELYKLVELQSGASGDSIQSADFSHPDQTDFESGVVKIA